MQPYEDHQRKVIHLFAISDFCVVLSHAVMSEQGVQEGTEHAPLRGPRVADQRGRCGVTYPYHLGAACQEFQDPVAEGGV